MASVSPTKKKTPSQAKARPASRTRRKPRVLIAEHSNMTRQSLAKLLGKEFEVVESASGEEAWQKLRDTRFNAALLDIDLPDFNGFGLLEQIRNARTEYLRHLAVTLIGNNEKEESQAYEAGADGFVCKPFDSQQLHELLNSLLDSSHRRHSVQSDDDAAFDELTNLPNKRYFDERGAKELAFVGRYHKNLALILFQIDHLEYIVEKHGASAAKQLVKKLGKYIQDAVRNEDTVARISGRRFGVLAPATDEFGAKAVADRVMDRVRARVFNYGDKTLSFTVSAGLAAPRPKQVKSFSHLFAITAERLETAVAAGGDRSVFDSRSLTEARADMATIEETDATIADAEDTGVHTAVQAAVPDDVALEEKTREKPGAEAPPTLEVGMWLLENGLSEELNPHYKHLLKEIMPLLENANEAMDNNLQDMLEKIKVRLLSGK